MSLLSGLGSKLQSLIEPSPAVDAEPAVSPTAAPPAEQVEVDRFQPPPGKGPAPTAGPATPPELQTVIAKLPKGTLDPADVKAMNARLAKLDPAAAAKETAFLKQALSSQNGDRALATWNSLKTMQDVRPDRLSNDVIHSLTLGVGDKRSTGAAGQEGVLGKKQALDAAEALTTMPQGDFDQLKGTLNYGSSRDGVCEASGADVETERALVLKAVAAHKTELASPGFWDKAKNVVGLPSDKMAEIQAYAQKIAGMPRDELVKKSTLIDLDGGSGAVQQRWSDSCGPTSMVAAKADADPMYALKLHDEPIHGTDTAGQIADQTKTILDGNGGAAVPRTAAGGVGMWPETGNTLDDLVGKYTNKTYSKQTLADTPAARTDALDRIDKTLRNGQDVPIVVAWDGGGSHVQMLTDVRGKGKDREFLLTDPWNGQTTWIKSADIAKGHTDFKAGTGRLWVSYE